jgi:integrase
MPKLTKRFVESVKPATADQVIFDDDLPGFGLRVLCRALPSGETSYVRSYLVQYRNKEGRSRRLTIGKHGKVTADGARKDALRIFDAVRAGKDPVAERRAYVDAPIVNDLLDHYLAEHVEKRNRPGTRREIKRLVDRHIRPELGKHRVAAVTRQDMVKLHRGLSGTPRLANLVLSICSKAFSLAEVWPNGSNPCRLDGSNPCRRVERNIERHRERFLSAEELGRLGVALRQAESEGLPWTVDESKPKAKHLAKVENRRTVYPRVTTAAIELLLYTGCRLSEVLNLRWDQVDFEAGTIVLAETKPGGPETIAMNAPARQVLKVLLPIAKSSPWVLPARDDPQARRSRQALAVAHPGRTKDIKAAEARALSKSAIEKSWRRIRAAAGIADVHLHDLRHTVGTYAGQSGANAFLVRDLLRHKDLSTTGIYVNRADEPMRTLSDQVGERIAAGLEGRKGGDVVALKRGG